MEIMIKWLSACTTVANHNNASKWIILCSRLLIELGIMVSCSSVTKHQHKLLLAKAPVSILLHH